MNTRKLRTSAPLAVPVLAAVAVVLASVLLAADLPDRVPSHWSGDGVSDATLPLATLTAVLAGAALGVGALLLAVGRQVQSASAQRLVGGLGVGMPVWLVLLHVAILRAAVGATGPVPFPRGAVLLALAGGLLAATVGAWLVVPEDRPDLLLDVPVLDVAPGEAVVWTGSCRADTWLVVLLGGLLVGLGTVLPLVAPPWVALVVVLALLTAVTSLRMTVTVGPAGVTARVGPVGVLRWHVPLADIGSVDAIEVRALAVGGWGLRLLPGLHAVVLREGPGIRLHRLDGPDLVLTLDDAPRAAGVLRAHLAAAGATVPGA